MDPRVYGARVLLCLLVTRAMVPTVLPCTYDGILERKLVRQLDQQPDINGGDSNGNNGLDESCSAYAWLHSWAKVGCWMLDFHFRGTDSYVSSEHVVYLPIQSIHTYVMCKYCTGVRFCQADEISNCAFRWPSSPRFLLNISRSV